MNKFILTSLLGVSLIAVSFGAVAPGSAQKAKEPNVAGSSDPSCTKDNSVQPCECSKTMEQTKMNVEVQKEPEELAEPDKEIEQEPEAVPGTKIEQRKNAEKRKDINLRAESFVVSDSWIPDGVIIGDKDGKYLISAGDTVYVRIFPDKVKPGMKCTIYRKLKQIKDKSIKEYMGYEIKRIGSLQFTDKIGSRVSSAVILVSYDTVEINDVVKFEE